MSARRLLAPLAVAVLFAGCGSTPKTPKGLFVSKCGGCHTLKAAGTGGHVGPNLDDVRPDRATVLDAIKHGRGGIMPPNLVSGDRAAELADYVSGVAGR